jgi:hypothetical protein
MARPIFANRRDPGRPVLLGYKVGYDKATRYRKRVAGAITRRLAERGLSIARVDELTRLANKFGSDKGTLFDGHGYTRIYKRAFEGRRHERISLLEIGLHRPDADRRRAINAAEGVTQAAAHKAPSLVMWRTFFPNANIFGFDIDDFSQVHINRCTIVRGDMSSLNDLSRLVQTIGQRIDIIIDDASHASHHQQIAFGYLFPYLRSGGIYAIEDLCWQDDQLEQEGVPKTRDVLRRFLVNQILESPVIPVKQRKSIQDDVYSIRLYDSLTAGVDDPSDALALLIRK